MVFDETDAQPAPARLSTKLRILLGIAACVLVTGLVLARLPANWFAYGLTQAVPGLYLTGVTGSLWRGQAAAGTLVIDDQGVALGKVSWDLSPASLLTLAPCADLQTSAPSLSFSSTLCSTGADSARLSNMELSIAAPLLSQWLPVKLRGQLSLLAASVAIKQQQLQSIDGSLSWRDGYFHNGQQWLDLGSYGARLSADGQAGLNAAVSDISGPFATALEVNLNPKLRPNSFTALSVKGELKPRVSAHQELTRWLPMLVQLGAAQPIADGYYIDWTDG